MFSSSEIDFAHEDNRIFVLGIVDDITLFVINEYVESVGQKNPQSWYSTIVISTKTI